jgi:hypothetical protein
MLVLLGEEQVQEEWREDLLLGPKQHVGVAGRGAIVSCDSVCVTSDLRNRLRSIFEMHANLKDEQIDQYQKGCRADPLLVGYL